jgi:hypothetical protein
MLSPTTSSERRFSAMHLVSQFNESRSSSPQEISVKLNQRRKQWTRKEKLAPFLRSSMKKTVHSDMPRKTVQIRVVSRWESGSASHKTDVPMNETQKKENANLASCVDDGNNPIFFCTRVLTGSTRWTSECMIVNAVIPGVRVVSRWDSGSASHKRPMFLWMKPKRTRQLRRRWKQSDFLLYTCTRWQHSMDFKLHDCECSHPRGMCPPTVQRPTSYTKWYSDCMLVKRSYFGVCLHRDTGTTLCRSTCIQWYSDYWLP